MTVACPVPSSAFAQPDTPFPAIATTATASAATATTAAIATAPAIAAGERNWGLT
jgi:hypothetical protein